MTQSEFLSKKIAEENLELKHLVADFNRGTHLLDVAFEIAKSYGRLQGLLLALSNIDGAKHLAVSNALKDTMSNATKTINNLF